MDAPLGERDYGDLRQGGTFLDYVASGSMRTTITTPAWGRKDSEVHGSAVKLGIGAGGAVATFDAIGHSSEKEEAPHA
ncbi:hypothetical protein [Streptomyces soliscabiei]|uniref:hypothetical protein n=1 Tax=Streptomyces soliscabiei TaxID=588897 RepID=UPI0029C000FA|nr:hypothetical protein [Streptomyces sp. NY05-11A]